MEVSDLDVLLEVVCRRDGAKVVDHEFRVAQESDGWAVEFDEFVGWDDEGVAAGNS